MLAKLVRALICGIGMGSVIGAFAVCFVSGRLDGLRAVGCAAPGTAVVGSVCAYVRSRIDAALILFGGPEHAALFISSGVLPALGGGALYGWLLYSRPGRALLARIGL